jgi:hypothetical protein
MCETYRMKVHSLPSYIKQIKKEKKRGKRGNNKKEDGEKQKRKKIKKIGNQRGLKIQKGKPDCKLTSSRERKQPKLSCCARA